MEKERTAYHEAAHAIVAAALGFMPTAIRIMRDGKVSPDGSIERWDAWRGGTDVPDRILSRPDARCEVAAAGFLAEAKWDAMRDFGAAALHETARMAEFIEQVGSWHTGRVEVRVPMIVAGQECEVKIQALDADIALLLPLDVDALSSALFRVRRRLNDPFCWSAVAELARILLGANPRHRGSSEIVSLAQTRFEAAISEFARYCSGTRALGK